jgi:hypothetical protein
MRHTVAAMTAGEIAIALRKRITVDDLAFDRLYPEHVGRLSRLHWTPMSAALRAVALLAPAPGRFILDVGAGAGKLCCVGALTRGGSWHGVERDPLLVAAAIAVAGQLGVDRTTRFTAGDATELDWAPFDSVYLYNPFEALLFSGGAAGFAEQVVRTEQRLAGLASGARVVTFHGFGGEMPASFASVAREQVSDGELVLWIQQGCSTSQRASASRPVS